MADQLSLTQVQYGCAVTAQASPNMTVAVAAGSVLVGNVPASVAAGNQTITAADAALDRVDSIVVNSSGTVSVLTGTLPAAGDNPQPPSSAGYALLATIYVLNQASSLYTGTITNTVITDQRGSQTASGFALIHTSPYKVSGKWYPPGGSSAGGTFSSTVNNWMYLLPIFLGKTLAIQALGIFYNSPVAGAGSVARLGLYQDDGAGAFSLLVDAGTVALDSGTSIAKTVSTSQSLSPGWWWRAIAFQNLTGQASVQKAPSQFESPIGTVNLPSGGIGARVVTGVTGALPSAPSSFDDSQGTVPMVWVQAT